MYLFNTSSTAIFFSFPTTITPIVLLTMSGSDNGNLKASSLDYEKHSPHTHAVDTEDADLAANNELHRGLENRHAQMISCVTIIISLPFCDPDKVVKNWWRYWHRWVMRPLPFQSKF
jgi:hypothetical protein